MTNLGGLGGRTTWGQAINDAGQVTGLTTTAAGDTRAFLYANGSMQSLGSLGGDSYGFDINASGQVTGMSSEANGPMHAFLYSNGVMQDLGALGGGGSFGRGLNDLGEVVGAGNVAGSYDQTAFLYSQGTMTGLGTLGGFTSVANDLNNLGQVVGSSMVNSDYSLSHAFIYSSGVMRDLNLVYSGLLSDGSTTGFLYLASAEDINDRGQITGYGQYFDGVSVSERGFLLNTQPLPPPSVPEETATLGLLTMAAFGLVCRRAGLRMVA